MSVQVWEHLEKCVFHSMGTSQISPHIQFKAPDLCTYSANILVPTYTSCVLYASTLLPALKDCFGKQIPNTFLQWLPSATFGCIGLVHQLCDLSQRPTNVFIGNIEFNTQCHHDDLPSLTWKPLSDDFAGIRSCYCSLA